MHWMVAIVGGGNFTGSLNQLCTLNQKNRQFKKSNVTYTVKDLGVNTKLKVSHTYCSQQYNNNKDC